VIILIIRTDKPESEIGLYDGDQKTGYEIWEAHRRLAETLHTKILDLLKSQQLGWDDIEGVIAYAGPGSFTGLRIGLSVANTVAYANGIKIVGTHGDNWILDGIKMLENGQGKAQIVPTYGSEAHITQPKK